MNIQQIDAQIRKLNAEWTGKQVYISGKHQHNGELGEVVMMEQCLSLVEQYYFYENMRYSPEEIKELPLFKDLITSNDKIRCKYNSMEIYYPLK